MSSDFPYRRSTYSLAWATFVNCSKEVKNNPMYSPVSCLSQNGTFIYVIISDYPGYQVNTVGDLVTSCSFLSMSPVDPDLFGQYYYYHNQLLKRVNLVNCTKEVVNNSMYWHVPCLSKTGSFIYLISHSVQEYRNIDLSTSCRFFTISPQDASVLTMHSNFPYAGSSFQWTSLVNCSKEVKNNSMYRHLPCLSRDGIFIYLVTLRYTTDLASSCEPLLMSPLDFASINYGQAGIFELLSRGFQLELSYGTHASISTCLKRSIKMLLDEFTYPQGPDERLFHFLSLVIGNEPEFLYCLLAARTRIKHFKLVFSIAVVVAVLLLIIKLLIVLFLLGRFVFAPLAIWAFLSYKLCKMMVSVDNIEKFLKNQQGLTPTRYAYNDIIVMTNNFKEKLGQGGFGSVFKGRLPGHQLVAIKMLGCSKFNGEEFINEVATIGMIHHVNVVKLIGFCSDGTKRALVYEYMPNGSLDKYIFSPNNGSNHKFSLDKLIDIALGIARGIDYLHKGCDMQILHFDIKPHNILLDHNFNPKVSDFGLAKLYPKDYNIISISVARGTIGYIAPELISRSFGVISHKSDVYSFGMLLLEMAGGRRNSDPKIENTSQVYYPSWIYDKLASDQMNYDAAEIVDLGVEIKEQEKKLCMIGLWCIQVRPSDRPSMDKVIEMLEDDVQNLQMPPKPFFSSSTSTNSNFSGINNSDNDNEGLATISEDNIYICNSS
ncbi:hypothetical protein J5N97_008319 [Dioscorea zingiberensis]|uniref:Protein kinase domain-containing protein n=1 Tax=Dioscorea zingiberensis TaxID=325984 RepID=A0A9D5DFW3_9LILI|nr:hypothetical protein J5N97_008319 [Dioscorea zingiberensis]